MLLAYQSRIPSTSSQAPVRASQVSLPRLQSLNDVLSAGQRHSSIRNDYISQELAASQYSGANFGPLASDVAAHLGAGFLPSEQQHLRTGLLKAIVQICWCVSPKLKRSLAADLASASASIKCGFAEIEHLLGRERSKTAELALREEQDKFGTALHFLFRGREEFLTCVTHRQMHCTYYTWPVQFECECSVHSAARLRLCK